MSSVSDFESTLESTMSGSSIMDAEMRVEPKRFKTKMCRNFMKDGHCPYEDRCMFAHGTLELRTVDRNERDGLVTEDLVKKFQTMVMLRRKFNANRPPPAFEEAVPIVQAPVVHQPVMPPPMPAPVQHTHTQCNCPSCVPTVSQPRCDCPNCASSYASSYYYTHNPYAIPTLEHQDLYEPYIPAAEPVRPTAQNRCSSYYSAYPCTYAEACTCPDCTGYTVAPNGVPSISV